MNFNYNSQSVTQPCELFPNIYNIYELMQLYLCTLLRKITKYLECFPNEKINIFLYLLREAVKKVIFLSGPAFILPLLVAGLSLITL